MLKTRWIPRALVGAFATGCPGAPAPEAGDDTGTPAPEARDGTGAAPPEAYDEAMVEAISVVWAELVKEGYSEDAPRAIAPAAPTLYEEGGPRELLDSWNQAADSMRTTGGWHRFTGGERTGGTRPNDPAGPPVDPEALILELGGIGIRDDGRLEVEVYSIPNSFWSFTSIDGGPEEWELLAVHTLAHLLLLDWDGVRWSVTIEKLKEAHFNWSSVDDMEGR